MSPEGPTPDGAPTTASDQGINVEAHAQSIFVGSNAMPKQDKAHAALVRQQEQSFVLTLEASPSASDMRRSTFTGCVWAVPSAWT